MPPRIDFFVRTNLPLFARLVQEVDKPFAVKVLKHALVAENVGVKAFGLARAKECMEFSQRLFKLRNVLHVGGGGAWPVVHRVAPPSLDVSQYSSRFQWFSTAGNTDSGGE